jgi:hypothetical protein
MTDHPRDIAARFEAAINQLGLRATHPGRPLTVAEDEAADRAAQQILADRDYAGLATDRDMDRAADDYFEPKDY